MKHVIRLLAVLALLMASVAAPVAALAVGPPVNDDWANAPVITDIPYSDAVDTTEATTTRGVARFRGSGLNHLTGRPASVGYDVDDG
jgi:hypothetical protein